MAQVDNGSAKRKGESESYENPPAQKGILARTGEYWTVGYGATTFSLKDIKGLGYLERLLQHPGEEFHALDLMSGPGARTDSESATVDERELSGDPNVRIGRPGDAGEVLDPQATRDYKRRILEPNEELEDLRERGNVERAEEVESERDFLANELGRGMGLGGRVRLAGSVSERARLSVTRAIKAALQKISEHHAVLGELLEHAIRTGSFCSYVPSPRVLVSWQFTLEGLKPSVGAEAPAPLFFRNETSFLRALADQTTFVGREAERATLRRCLEQALDRKAKVVMIGGAPGVGKTRIAREIGAEASEQGFRVLAGSCYDRDDSVPFMPFVEILEAALARAASPQAFREALGDDAAEIARFLPQLRRLFADIPPPPDLPPEHSRRIMFNALANLLARTAANTPVLLLLEDLHWADEGTLSLLRYLTRLVPKMRVLIVATYRDLELDTGGLAETLDETIRLRLAQRISLGGLQQNAVAAMLRALSGQKPPDSVVRLFHSETEGNPFFVEELFRHLREQGKLVDPAGDFRRDLKVGEVDVPQSLRLVIGRRLARITNLTQKSLGTAAVIGRSFTFELLEASTRTDPDSLLDSIEEAEKAGLISSTVQYPEARFKFSHELIRQAVVGRLSAARRQRIHLDIADAIERLYANALEDHASDLAHHLWRAGAAAEIDKTVRYLAMAAKQAITRSANLEAIEHLTKGIDLLRALPESSQRGQTELALQLNLGMVLTSSKGYSAPDVQRAFDRARELCQPGGDDFQLFFVLRGLAAFYSVRADYKTTFELGEQCLSIAKRLQDPIPLVGAHMELGAVLFCRGEFSRALEHLEQGIGLYYANNQGSQAFLHGQDFGVCSLSRMSLVLWFLGYPDQAISRSRQAVALSREVAHPFSMAYALVFGTLLSQLCGDAQAVLEQSSAAITLSNDQGFPIWVVAGEIFRGWALTELGQLDVGTERMIQGLSSWRAMGAVNTQTYFLFLLAEVRKRAGQFEEGTVLLTEMSALMNQTGERCIESDLYRLKGELLLNSALSAPNSKVQNEALECFDQAIAVARSQNAKSLELRAVMSLSKLWLSEGKKEKARALLAETHQWFTEGFGTKDLKQADALLREMS